ncbi:hypothetical protein COJ27_25955 [Bacillus cereus]|nr:hypothetical protein CON05_04855 [Bacillus cereus]PEO09691.1 hypothetical protein CN546_29290 [Bacillus wiedmannii]PGX85276.1 hypothetical protein COE45_05395 [Bacillus thuringiensis]PFE49723.1 hypothetical protein CN317_05015 [Bacillus cereus]PFL58898.1 hypothetical protein COJ27_25955 [Bacillus cereus]
MNKKLLAALTCSTLLMEMTACKSNDTTSTTKKSKHESKTNDKPKKYERKCASKINTTIGAGSFKYSININLK